MSADDLRLFHFDAEVFFHKVDGRQDRDVGAALAAARAEVAQIRRDFAAKMTCPVYEGYPYGHVNKSFTIDFLREKTITADGVLKQ